MSKVIVSENNEIAAAIFEKNAVDCIRITEQQAEGFTLLESRELRKRVPYKKEGRFYYYLLKDVKDYLNRDKVLPTVHTHGECPNVESEKIENTEYK